MGHWWDTCIQITTNRGACVWQRKDQVSSGINRFSAMVVFTSSCATVKKSLNEKISADSASLLPREQALSLVVETLKVTPAIPSPIAFDWGWVIKGFLRDGKNEDVTNKGKRYMVPAD